MSSSTLSWTGNESANVWNVSTNCCAAADVAKVSNISWEQFEHRHLCDKDKTHITAGPIPTIDQRWRNLVEFLGPFPARFIHPRLYVGYGNDPPHVRLIHFLRSKPLWKHVEVIFVGVGQPTLIEGGILVDGSAGLCKLHKRLRAKQTNDVQAMRDKHP